jgi:predicted MPP superfamily phosphohydrolase
VWSDIGLMQGRAEAPTLSVGQGLVERARVAFFRSFFRLLLVFIALAEWVCIAWVAHAFDATPPAALHVLAPAVFYFLNYRIIVRRGARRSRLVDAAIRVYASLAFTSIFCAVLLIPAGLVWLTGTGLASLAGIPADVSATVGRCYYWLVNAGFATVGGLLIWGYTVGQRQLIVSSLDAPIRDLPPELDGFRIVQLSDLHIGNYMDLAELAAHVERVNALEPDLVCLTGDLVDRPETCTHAFPTLGGLRARHGVLAILGNHDFYAGADTVTAALRELTPFTVLRNALAVIERESARLVVVGVDDLGRDWARGVPEHPALPALATAAPSGAPLVVLSHRPDCFPQAAKLGAGLQLSGHTHGGQLAVPWLPGRPPRNLAEFISRFHRGLYREGDATLYVNRGLGFTGQRIRLFTSREIALVTLRAA